MSWFVQREYCHRLWECMRTLLSKDSIFLNNFMNSKCMAQDLTSLMEWATCYPCFSWFTSCNGKWINYTIKSVNDAFVSWTWACSFLYCSGLFVPIVDLIVICLHILLWWTTIVWIYSRVRVEIWEFGLDVCSSSKWNCKISITQTSMKLQYEHAVTSPKIFW